MKKIVLLCASGMSTSILMNKMREAAKELNYDCEIVAHAIPTAKETASDADMVLLGPQVSYQLNNMKGILTCPVEVIDMMAYGIMDGTSIIKHVQEVIG